MDNEINITSDLLRRVPASPDEPIPAGATENEIIDFEKNLGYSLPFPFRKWLELSNGPCVGPGGFFGIGSRKSSLNIETYFSVFPHWRENKWIPIAGDGFGNFYVLIASHQFFSGFPVAFIEASIDAEYIAYVVASDIWLFTKAILEKELFRSKWPFDSAYVFSIDPDISLIQGLPFPWGAS